MSRARRKIVTSKESLKTFQGDWWLASHHFIEGVKHLGPVECNGCDGVQYFVYNCLVICGHLLSRSQDLVWSCSFVTGWRTAAAMGPTIRPTNRRKIKLAIAFTAKSPDV